MQTKEKINILFINGDIADYLHIGILNGLKSLPNVNVVDYPKAEIIYAQNRKNLQYKIRGKGFSLFFQHEEHPVDRFHVQFDRHRKGDFDLVIFGDIHNSFGQFIQFYPYLDPKRTIILDGADSESLYPYNGFYWRRPYYWFLPRAHKKFTYYKRELTPNTLHYLYYKLVPRFLCKFLPFPKNINPISFSIPDSKIVKKLPEKTKLFPRHIVDEEVAEQIDDSFTQYAFESEEEYYKDLQASKFGITTKRSGWDCLRHYEITANGAVICFKNLENKPTTCAPHDLIPNYNCISYKNCSHLLAQIENMSEERYIEIQKNSLLWIKKYSCNNVAKRLIQKL